MLTQWLTLSAHYKGGRRDLNDNDLGEYTVFNGKYIYRIRDSINLSLIARNIFNKRYVIEEHDPQYTTGYKSNDYFYEGVSLWGGVIARF